MENIDDLMRQKFDTDDPGARFEFQEEYWEQAQAMLEADEQRRKRRFLWWWLSPGCLLTAGGLLLAVGGWWWYAANGSVNTARKKEGIGFPDAKNSVIASGATESVSAQSTDKHLSATTESMRPQASLPARPPIIEKHTASNAEIFKKHTSSAMSGALSAPKQSTVASVNQAGRSGEEASFHPEPSTSIDKNFQPSSQEGEAPHSESVANRPLPLALLPVDYQMLDWARPLPELRPAIPEKQAIQPRHERAFSWAAGGAASFLPSTSAGWLGASVGVTGEYRLSQRWRVMAGAGWRCLPLESAKDSANAPSKTTQQLRYSFGFTSDVWSLDIRRVHIMECPIGLRWHWRSFTSETGAIPSRLMGVRAHLVHTQSSSLDQAETTRQLIWTDPKPYRKIWISPFAGGAWESGHLQIAVRAVLLPNDILTPADVRKETSHKSGWLPCIETGLRWKF